MSQGRVQTASHPTARFYEGNRSALDILSPKSTQIFCERGGCEVRGLTRAENVRLLQLSYSYENTTSRSKLKMGSIPAGTLETRKLCKSAI